MKPAHSIKFLLLAILLGSSGLPFAVYAGPFCGDGNIDTDTVPPEECDEGDVPFSTLCNNTTDQFDGPCQFTICGDNVIQTPNGEGFTEECEPPGTATCNAICMTVTTTTTAAPTTTTTTAAPTTTTTAAPTTTTTAAPTTTTTAAPTTTTTAAPTTTTTAAPTTTTTAAPTTTTTAAPTTTTTTAAPSTTTTAAPTTTTTAAPTTTTTAAPTTTTTAAPVTTTTTATPTTTTTAAPATTTTTAAPATTTTTTAAPSTTTTTLPAVPVCGDGNLDVSESCDDGNILDGDGCTATCEAETVTDELPGGGSVTLTTSDGQGISGLSVGDATGGPSGVSFPFGVISYTASVPNPGDSVEILMEFSDNLPVNLVLYKVDLGGVYAELPTSLWSQVDARTVNVKLTDGDALTDLDGMADGSIDDPIAVGGEASFPFFGGNGGGGCTLGTNASTGMDPIWLFLLAAPGIGYLRRRVGTLRQAA